MFAARLAGEGEKDCNSAAHQGRCFLEAVCGLQQLGQVVEVSGHVGMLRAATFLVSPPPAEKIRLA